MLPLTASYYHFADNSSSVEYSDSREDSRILLVSLLDGRIAAVDQETGRQLWIHDTGQPLVSNKGIAGLGEWDKATIFPGADGSLYAYRHDAHSFEV